MKPTMKPTDNLDITENQNKNQNKQTTILKNTEKNIAEILKNPKGNEIESSESNMTVSSKTIWIFWKCPHKRGQIFAMSDFLRLCISSVRYNNPDWDVIVVNPEINIDKYLKFDNIELPFKNIFDSLSSNHQSDVFRSAILDKYGGIYSDATILSLKSYNLYWNYILNNKNNIKYIAFRDKPIFSFWTTWFIIATKNSQITKEFHTKVLEKINKVSNDIVWLKKRLTQQISQLNDKSNIDMNRGEKNTAKARLVNEWKENYEKYLTYFEFVDGVIPDVYQKYAIWNVENNSNMIKQDILNFGQTGNIGARIVPDGANEDVKDYAVALDGSCCFTDNSYNQSLVHTPHTKSICPLWKYELKEVKHYPWNPFCFDTFETLIKYPQTGGRYLQWTNIHSLLTERDIFSNYMLSLTNPGFSRVVDKMVVYFQDDMCEDLRIQQELQK